MSSISSKGWEEKHIAPLDFDQLNRSWFANKDYTLEYHLPSVGALRAEYTIVKLICASRAYIFFALKSIGEPKKASKISTKKKRKNLFVVLTNPNGNICTYI